MKLILHAKYIAMKKKRAAQLPVSFVSLNRLPLWPLFLEISHSYSEHTPMLDPNLSLCLCDSFQYKCRHSIYGISVIKIRGSWDRLFCISGIANLLRLHHYIGTACGPFYYHGLTEGNCFYLLQLAVLSKRLYWFVRRINYIIKVNLEIT